VVLEESEIDLVMQVCWSCESRFKAKKAFNMSEQAAQDGPCTALTEWQQSNHPSSNGPLCSCVK